MYQIYKKVLPKVHEYLREWRKKAKEIPNPELRTQALASIDSKTFHCEGGSIYGILAKSKKDQVIRFIVAYQTISDYLDNLCDRSTSLDPQDFRALHESMPDALNPVADTQTKDYYRFREEKDDGGYLKELVKTCQECIQSFPGYSSVMESNLELANLYCDLQVYKHVKVEERVPRLTAWFDQHKSSLPDMSWYEFSACTGSTLGIFCLTSYAADNRNLSVQEAKKIQKGYFPYVQGLHILMDYFIDQEEDRAGGDLNFCFYYPNEDKMMNRMEHFYKEAGKCIRHLPDWRFHQLITNGLLAIYLADDKVKNDPELRKKGKQFIRGGGAPTLFFYLNGWLYRRISKT
nr:tetraprenyl-beta-curcumene synthase family protein [Evansella tamaricis]